VLTTVSIKSMAPACGFSGLWLCRNIWVEEGRIVLPSIIQGPSSKVQTVYTVYQCIRQLVDVMEDPNNEKKILSVLSDTDLLVKS
jgi:hypothetical protein